MPRPKLLYLSPVMPALTGHGLAMRAGIVLEALAADHDVHLLVIPVVGAPPRRHIDSAVGRWTAAVEIHPVHDTVDPLFQLIARIRDPRERLAAWAAYPRPSLCRFAITRSIRKAADVFSGVPFREVHVFRLYLAPFAQPYLEAGPGARPTCRLDLDDHESRTRRRIAELYAATGDTEAATREGAEAEQYAAMEHRYLPRFDRVYTCSERDRLELVRGYGCANVAVVPNAVRLPPPPPPVRGTATFTLLFLGTLDYYPNADAARFLCRDILPRLRARARRPVRVRIVGARPSRSVRALSAPPEVTVVGPVPEVAAVYQDADAVAVPVRAGGGTRIKVLEAFSFRRPVVSTTVGAEGLDVGAGVHLLTADAPDDFAAQCVRLMETPILGSELAERAFAFVRAHHTPERVRDLLRRDCGHDTGP